MYNYKNIDEVLGQIIGPQFFLARANRFFVSFSFPRFGLNYNISHFVESIEIPNLTLSTLDYQLNSNPIIKVPYARTPGQSCTVTFRENDTRLAANTFDRMLKQTINHNNGDYFVQYPEDTWGEITFSAFDTENLGKPVYQVKLIAAYPIAIEAVQYSHDDRDSYIKQTINFAYNDVEVI
jgi:hypothetical protein